MSLISYSVDERKSKDSLNINFGCNSFFCEVLPEFYYNWPLDKLLNVDLVSFVFNKKNMDQIPNLVSELEIHPFFQQQVKEVQINCILTVKIEEALYLVFVTFKTLSKNDIDEKRFLLDFFIEITESKEDSKKKSELLEILDDTELIWKKHDKKLGDSVFGYSCTLLNLETL